MRFGNNGVNVRGLSRLAAILATGSFLAGCSSGVARFENDVYAVSGTNQSAVMSASADQAYSGGMGGPVDATRTGSINRVAVLPPADLGASSPASVAAASPLPPPVNATAPVQPVTTSVALAPVAEPASSSRGVQVASVAPQVSESAPVRQASQPRPQMSESAGGNGAPATEMAALPSEGVPLPRSAPKTNVAVLPETPRPKERSTASLQAAADDARKAEELAAKRASEATAVRVASASADDGVTLTSYAPPRQAESLIEESAAAAPDSTGISGMRWPVRGRVVAGYGQNVGSKPNDGIDIAVPEGTPIKAAENGVVIYAGDSLKEFGNTVLVRHEDGMVTVYGHASQIKVSRGDKVKRGQDIALAGMTGSADMPKLHFEVRKNATPVDPAKYLE